MLDNANRRNILITGATGGIGSALAKEYASNTTRLILTGRNAAKLAEVAKVCEERGSEVIQYIADVSDVTTFSPWIVQINQQHPIDLLIANAGVNLTIGNNGEPEALEATRHLLNVNVFGMINTVTPLVASMQARQQGQIAIVSSLAAYRGLPQCPAYCASKAAIKAYGESLRAQLRKDNVRVNVICPGFVKTAMSDSLSGPKPLLMSVEKAAKVIRRGLAKNTPVISFPFALSSLTKLSMVLPTAMVDSILNRVNTTL